MAKISIPFYFRNVELIDNSRIPSKGEPIILAPNHQNAFLDAIVVALYFDRPVYFLARASVFQTIFNKFLRAINMRPVFRLRDGYENLEKNKAVFKECSDLLKDGKTLLIFPEADHGEEYFLRPLSRGIPRIVSLSQKLSTKQIQILPIGLNYSDHFNSGCELMIHFGESFSVDEIVSENLTRGKRLNEIRDELASRLSTVMLIPEKDALYPSKKSFVKSNGHQLSYTKLKKKLGKENLEVSYNSHRLGWSVLILILSIPNLPFHIFSSLIIKLFVSQRIFHASVKFALVMLLGPIWIIGIFILIFVQINGLAAIVLLLIQLLSAFLRCKWKANLTRT